jgi:flagellar protein FlaJ
MSQLFFRLSRQFKGLTLRLRQSGLAFTPEVFMQRVLMLALYGTAGIGLILFAFAYGFPVLLIPVAFFMPVLFLLMFSYFLRLPDVYIARQRREINQELIYAGRFLVVELKSGVLLYDALKAASYSYKSIGKYFRAIVSNVDLGTNLEDALVDAIEFTPSEDLRRVLWQMLNAINTGADIADSLTSVVEQITRQQIIEINQYAHKLNPLAMFYMMIAVILPSLGVTLLVVMSSFFPITLDRVILVSLACGLGVLQLAFVAIIKSSRPAVGL